MSDHYYAPDHLKAFGTISEGAPELGKKFFEYYSAVIAAGALTEREKALIALAVAHTVQCPYCIDAYTTECLQKGSDLEQMTEAVHVACAIRGGPAIMSRATTMRQAPRLDCRSFPLIERVPPDDRRCARGATERRSARPDP